MVKIISPLPIADQVADVIRKSIMEGELRVGEKISVSLMAERLGVSATPIKQAFKMLQTEGLLKTIPRSGTVISDLALQSLENTSILRSSLEGAAAFLAAKNATTEEVAEMKHLLDMSDQAITEGNIEELVEYNAEFHRKIRKAAKNTYLYFLIERLISFDYTVRSRALRTEEEREKGRVEHRKILQLIESGEAEKAEAALVTHIRSTAESIVPQKNK